MQSLITPYPKRGYLDILKPGQEDEATEDPDGVPWEIEDDNQVAEAEQEQHGEDETSEDEAVPHIDPRDWAEGCAPSGGADVEVADFHGDGDSLSAQQSDVALAHSGRLSPCGTPRKSCLISAAH